MRSRHSRGNGPRQGAEDCRRCPRRPAGAGPHARRPVQSARGTRMPGSRPYYGDGHPPAGQRGEPEHGAVVIVRRTPSSSPAIGCAGHHQGPRTAGELAGFRGEPPAGRLPNGAPMDRSGAAGCDALDGLQGLALGLPDGVPGLRVRRPVGSSRRDLGAVRARAGRRLSLADRSFSVRDARAVADARPHFFCSAPDRLASRAGRRSWSSAGFRGHGAWPSRLTWPLSGPRSPSMISRVVVLPASFGPRMPKNSPWRTSNVTPSTACNPP